MFTATITPTTDQETKLSHGGTGFAKRHIVERKGKDGQDAPIGERGGPLADKALCGASWDRSLPIKGDICQNCLAIYKSTHPGWPIPR